MFGTHHTISSAVSFAQNHGNLGNSSFTVSIEQLGSVNDDSAVFLGRSRKEARNVNQRKDRNIECITKTHKACCLAGSIDIQYPGQIVGLVGNNTHRHPVKPGVTNHNIRCIMPLDFKKFILINN
ncbi:hypothetical protein DSECCO2_517120 [anaerobic digester metagenome]